MIFYLSKKVVQEFESNFIDWCLGGPKEKGWTREGDPIKVPSIKLDGSYKFCTLHVDEGLAKNKKETLKWHISFLQGSPHLYQKEYLELRYNEYDANDRMSTFLSLLGDIKNNGIKKSIWVADVSHLKIGFNYFRFNGCHRLCCAKFLNIQNVPAIVFNTSLV
jgi:hypothetical protein